MHLCWPGRPGLLIVGCRPRPHAAGRCSRWAGCFNPKRHTSCYQPLSRGAPIVIRPYSLHEWRVRELDKAAMPPTTTQLLPLISSTATLTIAAHSHAALLPFLSDAPRPGVKRISKSALSSWFNRWFRSTLGAVVLCGSSSAVAGFVNYRSAAALSPLARRLYAGGALAAAGHFLFAYPISWKIKEIVETGPRDTRTVLQEWLRINALRTLTVDLAAFGCFLGALLNL